jgi:hypothetical protein
MNITALASTNHAKYIRRKNQDGFRLKYSLTHTERQQLVREIGIHALVLFEYYLRLASTENALITDKDAADYFDWSAHTAKRHRLNLSKHGWLGIEKASLSNGRRVEVYYLGKDEVEAANLKPGAEPVAKTDSPKPVKRRGSLLS